MQQAHWIPVEEADARKPALTRSSVAFGVLQLAAVVSFLVQLGLDANFDNVASAGLVLASSTMTLQYLRLSRSFTHQPLSSFAVLGLCVTTQWGALVTQSCALTPIQDNLRAPTLTFSLLGAYQLVALVALWLSGNLRPARRAGAWFARRVLEPVGIYELPSPGNLWVIGAVGFASTLAAAVLKGEGGVAGKLIDSCRFLAWAPFVIPVLAGKVAGYCDLRRQWFALGGYALLVVGLGMATNARSTMFIGVATVGLLALMLALGSDERVRPSGLLKAIPIAMLAVVGVGYASDLAVATVIVRDQRSSAGPLEMIELTLQTLLDRQRIEAYQDGINMYSQVALYDEYYIANPVIARFIETKFHDNMFFLSADMQPAETQVLWEHAIDSMWATIPEPILHFFGVKVYKADLVYSVGDLFDYLHYGNELGGFKIGSIFAHGQGLFGAWFFAVYLVMCFMVFVTWDGFSRPSPDGTAQLAPVAMLSAWGIFFNTIAGDSILIVIGFVTRGTIQLVLVYATIYAASKLLFRPHDASGASRMLPPQAVY